jgi:hypothetical protein
VSGWLAFAFHLEAAADVAGRTRRLLPVLCSKISFLTSQLHTPTPAADVKPSTTSQATHLSPVADAFTGYTPPSRVRFDWVGTDAQGGELKAWTENATGSGNVGEDGLIEKVDVLGEIPYLCVPAWPRWDSRPFARD